jgi:Zn-dependent peptidase ImmA (M78 family)
MRSSPRTRQVVGAPATIAHELGHHVLSHHDRFDIDVTEDEPPGYDWQTERAANEFAADLLMPRDFVVSLFQQAPDTQRLARQFKVSELAMGYRVVNLGLR